MFLTFMLVSCRQVDSQRGGGGGRDGADGMRLNSFFDFNMCDCLITLGKQILYCNSSTLTLGCLQIMLQIIMLYQLNLCNLQ